MPQPTPAHDLRMQFISAERLTSTRLQGTEEGEMREAGKLAGGDLVREFLRKQGAASNPIQAKKCAAFLEGVAAALVEHTRFPH